MWTNSKACRMRRPVGIASLPAYSPRTSLIPCRSRVPTEWVPARLSLDQAVDHQGEVEQHQEGVDPPGSGEEHRPDLQWPLPVREAALALTLTLPDPKEFVLVGLLSGEVGQQHRDAVEALGVAKGLFLKVPIEEVDRLLGADPDLDEG
jgi:hypothetical protein